MAIRNFASVLADLEQMCTPQEFGHVLASFISSIQYSDDLKLLNTEKLFFVYNLLSSSRFYKNNHEVAHILNPTLVQTIKAHLGGLAARLKGPTGLTDEYASSPSIGSSLSLGSPNTGPSSPGLGPSLALSSGAGVSAVFSKDSPTGNQTSKAPFKEDELTQCMSSNALISHF